MVYDQCPKSYGENLWWPRTGFNLDAIESCPPGAEGRSLRTCNETGWGAPDLFNCTSNAFLQLRNEVNIPKSYYNAKCERSLVSF